MYTLVQFVTSNKEKYLLVYDGYMYKVNEATAQVRYSLSQGGSCNATFHSDANDQYLKSKGNYESHLSSQEQIDPRLFRETVKKTLLSG